MIRRAHMGDIAGIVRLGQKFLVQSVHSHTRYDATASANYLARYCTGSHDRAMFVSDHDGVVRGTLMLDKVPVWWSTTEVNVVNDLFICDRAGDGVRLLRQGLGWAWRDPRVVDVLLTVNSGINMQRSIELLDHLGFIPQGVTLARRVVRRTATAVQQQESMEA